jgi:hypothetical protein
MGMSSESYLVRCQTYRKLLGDYLAGSMPDETLVSEYNRLWREDREIEHDLRDPSVEDFCDVIDRGFTCIDDWLDRDDIEQVRSLFTSELKLISDELAGRVSDGFRHRPESR